jgi:hypothetical protein
VLRAASHVFGLLIHGYRRRTPWTGRRIQEEQIIGAQVTVSDVLDQLGDDVVGELDLFAIRRPSGPA